MLTMYPGMVNSPITELAAAIDDVQTTITVVDGTKLPDAPNLAIIGLGEDAETILYTEKTGNVLSGVTRGFQGVAKAWGQGARIARFFTEYDQRAMMQNIQENADNLAAHLNDKLQDGVHGLATTQDLTLYVDATNGDDSNDGLSPQTAFKTIQTAVNSLPQIINHTVTIRLANGVYIEPEINIAGFVGKGSISIIGDESNPTNVLIDKTGKTDFGILILRCVPIITIRGVYLKGTPINETAGINSIECIGVNIQNCQFDSFAQANSLRGAVYISSTAIATITNCVFNSNYRAIISSGSRVYSANNSGTDNVVGLFANTAGVIGKIGTQPGATTAELTASGGEIR